MKLTTYHRDAIVRAIFQDVPVADGEQISEAVQKALVKAMSPACKRAYKTIPHALATRSSYDLTSDRTRYSFVVGDANFDEVTKPWLDAKAEYFKTKERLQAAVYACNTLKQLHTTLPEFASYFPKENEPTKNLPALANVVADIVKLGWKAKVPA